MGRRIPQPDQFRQLNPPSADSLKMKRATRFWNIAAKFSAISYYLSPYSIRKCD
jgi:hypothetical protein